MFTVYILLCDELVYYVGITDNAARRLEQHLEHESFFTKRYQSVRLVYRELYETRILAAKREKQLKGWSSAKKTALINNDIPRLKQLSKRKKV